jgi:hypothetical protein
MLMVNLLTKNSLIDPIRQSVEESKTVAKLKEALIPTHNQS